MDNQEFSRIEDFVFDKSFREWVLNNHDAHAPYWNNWVTNNPQKAALFNYAKAIVYALSVNHRQLSDAEMNREIQSILKKANDDKWPEVRTTPADNRPSIRKPLIKRLYPWIAGAAAILLITVGIIYFQRDNSTPAQQAGHYELPAAGNNDPVLLAEQTNHSDTVQVITLADGSTVKLFGKSTLRFAQHPSSKKREVYLTGEAFFEVKKNPAAPFFVYTQNMVTKVLGTSFTIKAYATEKKASVQVKTGKVSVYKKENFSDKNLVANKLDGVIVTPNQQVVFDFETNQLSKTIVDKPAILSNTADNRFVFSGTPLKEVFKTLQDAYGINIMYDEYLINSCTLSASMGSETFYEKLNLICKAIDATYESIDGNIFIALKGCS